MRCACGRILTNSLCTTTSKLFVTGTVLQINVSRGGIPKLPVESAMARAEGLEGDGHANPNVHCGPRQAVLVIAAEAIAELQALGYALYPGALGENITTEGIDYRTWRAGQRWRIGDHTVLEFTKLRTPCQTLFRYGAGIHAAIYDERVKAGDPSSPKWCMSGMYASVITPGVIQPGDSVVAVEPWSA